MSQESQVTVACPKCGAKQKAKLYTSVDVTLEPKLRLQVVEKKLNSLKCKKCAAESTLEAPFLYQDHQRDFMVQLASDEQFTDAHVEAAFEVLEGDTQDEITTRRVRSYDALVEKILTFEAKLDDRVVEIMKLQVKKQQPEMKDFPFMLVGATRDALRFHAVTDQGLGRFDLPFDSYKALAETLKELGLPAREPEQWCVIDGDHAAATLKRLDTPIQ
jgi:hypothetical protein